MPLHSAPRFYARSLIAGTAAPSLGGAVKSKEAKKKESKENEKKEIAQAPVSKPAWPRAAARKPEVGTKRGAKPGVPKQKVGAKAGSAAVEVRRSQAPAQKFTIPK